MSSRGRTEEELLAEVARLRTELLEAWDEGYTDGYFKTRGRDENPYREGA